MILEIEEEVDMASLNIFTFRFWSQVCILCVAATLFSVNSQADWRLLPGIDLEERYDSNIYLRPNHETSDFITELGLSIGVEEVSASRTFGAHYTMGIVNFRRHSDDDYVGHTADLSWDQQLTRNLSWHISDTYYQTEEPLEEDRDIVSLRDTRNRYSRNAVDTGFTYQFGEEDRVTVSYLDSRLQNTDPEVEDSLEYGPGLEFEYWLTRRHGITLNYSWRRTEYENDPAVRIQDMGFGYNWRWSPHTTLHLDYGLELFYAKDPADEDYRVHDVSGGFDHDFGPSWTLSGTLGYYYRDPVDSPSEDGVSYGLTLGRSFPRGTVTLSGSGGYRLEYTDADRRGFTEYRGVSLSAGYSVSPRTELYLTSSYTHEDSDDPGDGEDDTRDDSWDVSVGTSYQILPWLSGALECTQRERTSSEEEDEYRDSLILLRLSAIYEWR